MSPSLRRALLAALAMVCFAVAAQALLPTKRLADTRPRHLVLENVVPSHFGAWHQDAASSVLVVNPQQAEVLNKIYSQTLSRTYVNDQGQRIMLALAYGEDQSKREGLQLHYPEICYPAQGFEVRSRREASLDLQGQSIPIRRLETVLGGSRFEPLTYWTMTGDYATLGGYRKKVIEMRYAFRGLISDGLLFRVSSIGEHSADEFALQDAFVRDLLAALDPATRREIAGIN